MAASLLGSVWRWGRGFDADELRSHLQALDRLASTGPALGAGAARDPSWRHHYSEAVIARERPGTPERGGAFERARAHVSNYDFSDPDIVQGYFATDRAFLGRPMLLELKVLGLHLLCGVVVRAIRDETSAERTLYGYRYDTLEGHPESGAEWFLLSKDHQTGEVLFRIEAAWRAGRLPHWWTRVGFYALASLYQRSWHRRAYLRLRQFLGAERLPAMPRSREILHSWQPSPMVTSEPASEVPGRILESED